MSRWGRTVVAGGGLLGLVAAVAVAVTPDGRAERTAAALVSAAGNDYLLAAGVAVASLLVVGAVLALRGLGGVEQATPPSPETVQDAPHPGVGFDRTVGGGSRLPFGGDTEGRDAVRERVRRAAVHDEMHRRGCSRGEARARVASGAWTDDAVAAAFLSDEANAPVTERLRSLVGSRFDRGAARAVDELWRRESEEGTR